MSAILRGVGSKIEEEFGGKVRAEAEGMPSLSRDVCVKEKVGATSFRWTLYKECNEQTRECA